MTNLELKIRIRELEERVRLLQKTVDGILIAQIAPKLVETSQKLDSAQTKHKLCPHCGEKPAYHFHVKNCAKKNKNNDGIGTSGAT